jgi:putative SbcD/Mre11-related phosphoesterase
VPRGYRVGENLELLPGGAALLTDENVLIVADLHLGCEAALEYEGVSLPRVQTKIIETYLKGVVEEVSPSRLVVAGDLKHNFSRNLIQEWQDVSRFVSMLRGTVALEVVKGNHDNYLVNILRDNGLSLKNEVRVGHARIVHGHSGARALGSTIMGHIHPSLGLRDKVGSWIKAPCYLVHERLGIIVLPALSIVSAGVDVVGQPSSDKMSPLLPENGLRDFVPVAFSNGRPLKFPSVGEMRDSRTGSRSQ